MVATQQSLLSLKTVPSNRFANPGPRSSLLGTTVLLSDYSGGNNAKNDRNLDLEVPSKSLNQVP